MKNKITALLFALILCTISLVPAYAVTESGVPRIFDTANVLDKSQVDELSAKLDSISEANTCDVVLLTLDKLDGYDASATAKQFFIEGGYGLGEEKSGVLFLLSIEDRKWAIKVEGKGRTYFSEAGQEYIMDQIMPLLKDDDFAGALSSFVNLADKFLTQASTGEPYNSGNLPKPDFTIKYVLIPLGIGLLIALIITFGMKSKLKSVAKKTEANDYVRPGSMNLTSSRDIFLYTTLDRVERPKESSSSGSRSDGEGGSSGSF